MKKRALPSREECHLHLSYNQHTGEFFRNARPCETYKTYGAARRISARDAGKPAGTVTCAGYLSIYLVNTTYMAHRLAWHMAVGDIPEGMVIDHINGNRLDNRLCNLRVATPTQNNQNHRPRKSKSGLKGVVWHGHAKAWQARIKINGKEKSLGLYKNKLLAYDAYVANAIQSFGEFARL